MFLVESEISIFCLMILSFIFGKIFPDTFQKRIEGLNSLRLSQPLLTRPKKDFNIELLPEYHKEVKREIMGQPLYNLSCFM